MHILFISSHFIHLELYSQIICSAIDKLYANNLRIMLLYLGRAMAVAAACSSMYCTEPGGVQWASDQIRSNARLDLFDPL